MRCLTLANALRERGAAVLFVCREHEGHLCDLLEKAGHTVSRLPAPNGGTQTGDPHDYAAWLGASWREDAEQTRAAIDPSEPKPDWLVVDHYAIDHRWETVLRTSVRRIMVIDDLADRVHDCDLLLDQNLVAQMRSRYADKVSAVCGMLLGPEFALLQPIYAELHDRIRLRKGPIRRILIFFGGADSHNLTGRTLAAFSQLNRPDTEVDVVISASSPYAGVIRQQVAGYSNIRLHSDLPTLAPLMTNADLAIGAGGATSWERLCLGLPSLIVTVAENQHSIADELSRRDLIHWLGHQDAVDQTAIAEGLGELIQQGLDENWSRRCLAVVDGKGIKRVCAALTVTATTPLRVRHAKLEDEALLLAWANDPTTRRNAFSPEPITAETHRNWLRARLSNLESCHLYLVETEESVPVGQVRFDRADETWRVDYALAPQFRGRGLGRPLLETALLKLREDEPGALVLGQVKGNNQSSRQVFESLGFDMRTNIQEEMVEYRRVL
jgi:UDP-2,4-diacetamido-2,4,6-trideoxy-beta-L-altropyranose hydrolase